VGSEAPLAVVVSDQPLVAEAVAAALSSLGIRARRGTLPTLTGNGPSSRALPGEVGLALIELAATDQAAAVAAAVAEGGNPWIVLAAPAAAAAWGDVLEAGGAVVLPHDSTLGDVVSAIRSARGERPQ
jgi:DNA-binding NarL/FixJ family response regulator